MTAAGKGRRRRRRATALLTVAALPAALLAASSSSAATPVVIPVKSLCVYATHTLEHHAAFEAAVGRPVDCAVVFNDAATSWQQWADPWFLRESASRPQYRWASWLAAGAGRRLVITQSLVPAEAPSDWRARGARGEYDAHIRALAQTLVARGAARSVIRLAPEANGTWKRDSIGDTPTERRAWAAYWARTVSVMRATPGAQFVFDWTVNSGYRAVPWSDYYPGDAAVDIIGIDQYDAPSLPMPAGATRFERLRRQRGGLDSLAAFARRHGKPLSVAEFGLIQRSRGGAGDDPAFVAGIAALARQQQVAYVGYFDHEVNGVLLLERNPRSLAEFSRDFAVSRWPG